MSVLARRKSVLDTTEIVLLRPITIEVGQTTIECVPMIVGDNTVIDVNVDTPSGPIEIHAKMQTSTFNEVVEMAQRYKVVPKLSALLERAGHKPKLLR